MPRKTIRQKIAVVLDLFKNDRAGVAAIEFGFILPLLLLMTAGVVEATRAVMTHKRFQRAVAMVADLTAREDTIGTTSTDAVAAMNGILKAAENAMYPYSFSSLKMGVTAISSPPSPADPAATTVAWSYSYNAYPVSTCGTSKNMPASGMISAGNSAILVEAQYVYTPLLANLVPGFSAAMTWTDQIANAPRNQCPNYAGKQCSC